MAYYQSVGYIPHKRHTQHRLDGGQLAFEELMGEEGFSSDSSLLYHRDIPSDRRRRGRGSCRTRRSPPNHPLLPLHLKLHDLFPGEGAKRARRRCTGRRLVLGNGDVRISLRRRRAGPSPFYRNGIGDECVYIERGSARVETVFGTIEAGEGDYVMHPARDHAPLGARPAASRCGCYAIEANSHIAPPKRYLSRYGQLLEHAPYCERDLRRAGRAAGSRTARDVEV